MAQTIKNLPAMWETQVRFPGSGRVPGEGNGNPLQDSCLENPMDRGAWRAIVHGVAESLTQLSDTHTHTHTHTNAHLIVLERSAFGDRHSRIFM